MRNSATLYAVLAAAAALSVSVFPAVAIAADDPEKNPAIPAPSDMSPVSATVRVDWDAVKGRVPATLFGSCDTVVTNPERGALDPQYAGLLDKAGIVFLRIHNSGLTDAWSDPAAQTWDEAKITDAFRAPCWKGRTLLLTIPRWPKWLRTQSDGTLDPADFDRYASFCADLVRLVNGKLGQKVRYWEPENEWEMKYEKAGKLDQLWALYNKTAQAMKAADPSIQVGGMAFAYPDTKKIRAFLAQCGANADFLSYHRYGSGNATVSSDRLMQEAVKIGTQAASLRELAAQETAGLHHAEPLPVILDEYNLNYTWNSGEARQWTSIGAVWCASLLKNAADAGLTMAASWNFKDRVYGMISSKDQPRPAATVYEWGTKYLTGELATTSSSNPMVEAFAVRRADHSRTILLINKSAGPATVTLSGGPPATSHLTVARLDSNGVSPESEVPASSITRSTTLLPYSLLLVRIPAVP